MKPTRVRARASLARRGVISTRISESIAPHDFLFLTTRVGATRARKFVLGMGYASTVVYSLVGVRAIELFEKRRPQLREILQKHGYNDKGIPVGRINEAALRADLRNLLEGG